MTLTEEFKDQKSFLFSFRVSAKELEELDKGKKVIIKRKKQEFFIQVKK